MSNKYELKTQKNINLSKIALMGDQVDFSGLFKLDVLVHLDISAYSFYEVGLKKFFAFSSNKELIFIYVNPQSGRLEKNYDWDFVDNPVYCMCFEPSGTWVLIISEQKVLLVPFLPLFVPQNTFDHKWSLSSVTVLPLGDIAEATSVVFWLTKESENIVIIGSKTGAITFYYLESQSIVGECKVAGVITDLQICFDDSLDLLTLLVSSTKYHHWKLVLEHRSFGYNWLQQIRAQNDKDKKDSFMSYIRQLSKDKITLFIQGGSKDDNKSQTVEYVLKPTDYLPMFRQGSNNWALTAQYVNGRHFLTAFELNEGTMILESPEENTPSRTLRPIIKKDGLYIQGLWSQRLIYLVRKNELEIHSANFSVIQGEGLLGTKRDFTQLWSAELIGDVMRAHLMSTKEPAAAPTGWQEPTFMCDLQLPRFSLEPCLIVTTHGAYVLSTMCDPCEWVVGLIMRGCAGAEQSAAGLGAAVSPLLRAAADMLMSRGKIAPAQYLYSLSQSQADGWVARLGVFTRLQELSLYKLSSSFGSLGNSAITLKLLAIIILMRMSDDKKFDKSIKFTMLNPPELLELTSFSAAMGLWELVPVFSIHRGHPNLLLAAIKARKDICRGALNCLLTQQCLVPILLEENGQWLFDFIAEKCDQFDTIILKRLCLWLNPLQDQLRPIMRDMKQAITTVYTTRMLNLIATFTKVACAVEAREPCPEIHLEVTQVPETWKNQFVPRRALSCGLAHWGVADEGNAKIMLTDTPINTELIGRVIDIACGRHHTLVLTENGIYAAGDNSFGQLGVGAAWGGAAGEAAGGGALRHVPQHWTAPLRALAAGNYHSAAVDVGGRLYTWGWGVHGQLGLGSIDDHYRPQLVTKLLGRKVVAVACGACHSAALARAGEVWAWGSGACGQLGARARKAAAPVRVLLPTADPAVAIAAGYFHNLALTSKGQVWTWGASPQQVRAAAARRANSPSAAPATPSAAAPAPGPAPASPTSPVLPDPPQETHMLPHPVDLANVRGQIVQLSAGWHHSCIMNNFGTIYGWGLNFDGQLGTGDRKQVQIPVEIKIRTDSQPDTVKNTNAKPSENENKNFKTKALVACGGDFTIYIDEDGRIYNSGNTHQTGTFERDKSGNRVIMMKTTKRIIKIPASRNNNKFMFQPIDRIDIMFPFDIDDLQRKPIEPQLNPLTSFKDFTTTSWADDVLLLLKSWINETNVAGNLNMAAKLAYHNNLYPDCLRLLLSSLKSEVPEDRYYITHTVMQDDEKLPKDETSTNNDTVMMSIRSIIAKRIKDISLTILNEEQYPPIDPAVYQVVTCCCDETKYIKRQIAQKFDATEMEEEISVKAGNIIDKCVSVFPVNTDLWEACFRIAKDFYVENKLSICELERVLRKYMESNPATMAGAILYSGDCAQYSEILTPKFYLNMCSQVLDSWG